MKKIRIYPNHWVFPRDQDMGDLRKYYEFVSIPPRDQAPLCVRHEVPRDKIKAAGLQKGERYKVSLTDKCLGTHWWTFGSHDELEGVRLRAWTPSEQPETVYDSELGETVERDQEGPVAIGEWPSMLAMVREVGDIEFDIVSDEKDD